MKRPPVTGYCTYCGIRPATEWHEEYAQRKGALSKYGKLIYHPLNCKLACNHCNGSHANVVTRNEYEFVVMMVDNRVLTFIPYKMDFGALAYISEKEAEGFLKVVGDKIIYAEEATA